MSGLIKKLKYRLLKGQQKELLKKAIGIKSGLDLSVLDCTAGYGEDSFVMAAMGCSVTMLERNLEIFKLLEQNFKEIKQDPDLKFLTENIISIDNTDSIEYLKNLSINFDIIYLDPMFESRKKSALVKKDMQILQKKVGEDIDADALFQLAFKKAKKRVVVKRALHAPLLASKQPSHQIKGKAIRFDVFCV